jgi:hypothetical protein
VNETKIKLEYPITASGKVVSEITLRRPKAKDRLASAQAATDEVEREIHLISLISGLAPEDIHEMDLADYLVISGAVEGFLSPRRKTSGKQSS